MALMIETFSFSFYPNSEWTRVLREIAIDSAFLQHGSWGGVPKSLPKAYQDLPSGMDSSGSR